MDESQWGLVNIIGPIILGLILVWAVLKARSRPKRLDDTPEQGTHDLYKQEEQRRREGTDGL